MPSIVISGGQWGDEGKAKITDLLSNQADFIIRYQGGANAGHTVATENGLFKFHLIQFLEILKPPVYVPK